VRHRGFETSGSDNATSSVPFRVCALGHIHSSETIIQRLCNTRKCLWLRLQISCANMNVSLTFRNLVHLRLINFYLSVCLIACVYSCELFVNSFFDEYVLFYLLLLFCNCHKRKPVTAVLLWKFRHIYLNLVVTQDKGLTGIQGVTWSEPCNFYAYVALFFRKHWLFYVLPYLTLNKIITINIHYLKQLWPAGLYNTESCCDVGTEFYARIPPPWRKCP